LLITLKFEVIPSTTKTKELINTRDQSVHIVRFVVPQRKVLRDLGSSLTSKSS